jgi:bifunctional enzyme CysN/CysC
LERVPARTLGLNEIGVAEIHLDRPVPFDSYADNHDMGGFVVIDRMSNDTVGAGLLDTALRRAGNVHWQAVEVDRSARSRLTGQRPAVAWFTGLSGAGKSTIANIVERKLHALGRLTYLLDGDNLRHGLNADLGFTAADRVENIRRTAAVAALMADAGLIVLVSLISPYSAERSAARDAVGDDAFLEVYVDVPLAVAEARDPKGLYAKARRGEIAHFTGIDAPYEEPQAPDLHIRSATTTAEEAADLIIARLLPAGAS